LKSTGSDKSRWDREEPHADARFRPELSAYGGSQCGDRAAAGQKTGAFHDSLREFATLSGDVIVERSVLRRSFKLIVASHDGRFDHSSVAIEEGGDRDGSGCE